MRYSNRSVLLYLGSEVERMGNELGASEEAQRDAIRLCGDVLRSDYDYDSVDSVAGACFHLACTRQNEPISLPQVAEVARKSQKNVQHLSAKLMGELDVQLRPVDPDTYLEDGADHFEFGEEPTNECSELLGRAKERNLHSGLAPTTVAGAILYAVAQKYRLDVRQRDVADFVGKTEVSIRNNFREILALADDVPVDVLPPQTVSDGIARLRAQFDQFPTVYAEEALDLANAADLGPAPSRAGVAGGAYYAVASRAGADVTFEEIGSAVGVAPQTVKTHSGRFSDGD